MSAALVAACLTFAGFVVPLAGARNAFGQAGLTEEQRGIVDRVEAYIDTLSTFSARFVQVNQEGAVATGDFHLSRPGKLKVVYDPPNDYMIVADGTWLTFWDGRLERRSDTLLGTTLADVLARDPMDLGEDIAVASAVETDTTLEVTLFQADDPGAGSLTLIIAKTANGLEIQRWRVVDAQSQVVEVTLSQIRYGVSFERGFFNAPRPQNFDRD